MKKQTVWMVAIVVIAITFLCEYSLSILNKHAWSNFGYSWDTTMTKKKKIKTASVMWSDKKFIKEHHD